MHPTLSATPPRRHLTGVCREPGPSPCRTPALCQVSSSRLETACVSHLAGSDPLHSAHIASWPLNACLHCLPSRPPPACFSPMLRALVISQPDPGFLSFLDSVQELYFTLPPGDILMYRRATPSQCSTKPFCWHGVLGAFFISQKALSAFWSQHGSVPLSLKVIRRAGTIGIDSAFQKCPHQPVCGPHGIITRMTGEPQAAGRRGTGLAWLWGLLFQPVPWRPALVACDPLHCV